MFQDVLLVKFILENNFYSKQKKIIQGDLGEEALFRNKMFMLDEITLRNASKFAIDKGIH